MDEGTVIEMLYAKPACLVYVVRCQAGFRSGKKGKTAYERKRTKNMCNASGYGNAVRRSPRRDVIVPPYRYFCMVKYSLRSSISSPTVAMAVVPLVFSGVGDILIAIASCLGWCVANAIVVMRYNENRGYKEK